MIRRWNCLLLDLMYVFLAIDNIHLLKLRSHIEYRYGEDRFSIFKSILIINIYMLWYTSLYWLRMDIRIFFFHQSLKTFSNDLINRLKKEVCLYYCCCLNESFKTCVKFHKCVYGMYVFRHISQKLEDGSFFFIWGYLYFNVGASESFINIGFVVLQGMNLQVKVKTVF